MSSTGRLILSVVIGAFVGWGGYPTLVGIVEMDRRCSTDFDPASHLAFSIAGVFGGLFIELCRRHPTA
jgi:hypothetical protein